MEPPTTVSPFSRERTPAYSHSSRETMSSLSPRTPPAVTASGGHEPTSGRGGGPPPYWQHLGEPTMFCTPIREMSSNRTGSGHRSTVPLPSVRDLFSPDASENERNVLPPIYMSPSVYYHMRDADPASAVGSDVGPRFGFRSESPSPDSGRSRGRETTLPESAREKTPEEFAVPATPGPSRAARASQSALDPLKPQVQVPGPSAEVTKFIDVDAHTAKCDVCNKRNVQGMTRCVECGWQTCNACTVKNNNFRSHRSGTVLHVGPVDKKKLPTAASVRKGKQAAKRKREDPDYVPESEKASKKKRATKTQVRMTGSTSNPSSISSSPDGSPNESAFADLSEDESISNAAQALYAMSMEASEMETWAMTRKFRKRWQYPLWVEDNDDGDDETEPMSMDEEGLDDAGPSSPSPLTKCIPSLRREVLEIARGEGECYRRSQRMGQVKASAMNLQEEKGKGESEWGQERVKSRAQTYARKRSGR
ncbi:hypothetical protein N8T08_003106 [Aspergillus melleus]|uniref:Uncharacterized protein n=1 Tax=Aspergillus melleus TaxID=138277 RepID=A0ACC3B7M3_9EURO|nr:hypothetical protein N8T08_003106 [Aspergillus melleus]